MEILQANRYVAFDDAGWRYRLHELDEAGERSFIDLLHYSTEELALWRRFL